MSLSGASKVVVVLAVGAVGGFLLALLRPRTRPHALIRHPSPE